MNKTGFRCGYVAVIGRPNVGKSTLVNALVKEKVSIVTDKPQTTRNRIHGIRNSKTSQMVFIDTPGLHSDHAKPINRRMNRAAASVLTEADVVLFLVAAPGWSEEDLQVLNRLDLAANNIVLVINKIDRLPGQDALLLLLADTEQRGRFSAIVPIAASKGKNLDSLVEVLEKQLPVGEAIFDPEMYTDQSMRFMASETIRERLMDTLHDELPYALAVSIDEFDEQETITRIAATIWVEKPGQKGIVIGKGGRQLKAVGSGARKILESVFGSKVHLVLWVKIREGWSEDESLLQQFGIGEK